MDTRLQARSPRAGARSVTPVVLVVDSSPALLQTLDSILQSRGWTCVTASDTLSALCCMVEHAPQIVLIDADSGPLAVWQFASLLRQHPEFRHVRLIVSSSRDDVVERARAEAAGAECFLPRPFAVDEVLKILGAQGEQA
ncbi:MAG: twitching motility regulator PilG [Pseudomonadota bacterium]